MGCRDEDLLLSISTVLGDNKATDDRLAPQRL
jgi:hypothetical protein